MKLSKTAHHEFTENIDRCQGNRGHYRHENKIQKIRMNRRVTPYKTSKKGRMRNEKQKIQRETSDKADRKQNEQD
jgi:hypothetical protein